LDLRTMTLMLAMGSFLYGLLLAVFKLNKNNPQKVPFWAAAKILQGSGALVLYFRTDTFDGLTSLAFTFILLGCAYEAWAVRYLAGKLVPRRLHIPVSAGIILACALTVFLAMPYQTGLVFIIQSGFYLLTSLFLFGKSEMRFSLRSLLAVCYSIAGSVYLVCAITCLVFPEYSLSMHGGYINNVIPGVSFFLFLVSGFVLLMLAKEKSDIQVLEIQRSLKESEYRFQKIMETAIEGILIFDENYTITFCNDNMAAMLGYTTDEMLGKTYASFFPESQLDIYNEQASRRKQGKDSVYECGLLRKDGQINWFLVSAKAILDDSGRFEGSFAMLTDINARKEMEFLLAETNRQLMELSNTDSLTGIANRRSFDSALEHEYYRLRRSNSELSVIMLDIDHFKEYNDYYGHVMGDECLRRIGRVLTGCVTRSVDLAARYGGEEFACILPDTGIQGAVAIAECIRQRIHELKIEHKESPVSEFVTASLGVATVRYSDNMSPADVVEMADRLMYKAKLSGRNRTEYAAL